MLYIIYMLQTEPILPPAIIISAIQWTIDEQIAEDMQVEPALLGGPEGICFICLTSASWTQFTHLRDQGIRQPANPLTHLQPLMVVQYDPGCKLLRKRLFHMCNL